MRIAGTIGFCFLLSGCAFPTFVERSGVEYNSALAEMNNEQTLLNILRAKDGMPTHFTSVSQFRGNINLTAGGNLNAQLRGQGLTSVLGSGSGNPSSVVTTTNAGPFGAAATTTSVATAVTMPGSTNTASSTIAEGVDLYTPQISGQLVSGTAFDVAVFDTQKFFQGITNALPFSTVETLLTQGIDNRVLMMLAIARVDFRAKEALGTISRGEVIISYVNDLADPSSEASFQKFVRCYKLGSGVILPEKTNLVAMSRITRGADDKTVALPIDKIIVLDGEKFDLASDTPIGDNPKNDSQIFLARVSGEKRVARLSSRPPGECKEGDEVEDKIQITKTGRFFSLVRPQAPTDERFYLGDGYALVYENGQQKQLPVSLEITFRSPEGLFRYLGTYLGRGSPNSTFDSKPLFTVADGRKSEALAQARYRGRHYSLVNDAATGTRNAQIFTLLQQLINLHKEAADRPTAIPVRAIP